jgi:hypothetical protein
MIAGLGTTGVKNRPSTQPLLTQCPLSLGKIMVFSTFSLQQKGIESSVVITADCPGEISVLL